MEKKLILRVFINNYNTCFHAVSTIHFNIRESQIRLSHDTRGGPYTRFFPVSSIILNVLYSHLVQNPPPVISIIIFSFLVHFRSYLILIFSILFHTWFYYYPLSFSTLVKYIYSGKVNLANLVNPLAFRFTFTIIE